jgi:hypothetical protein
MCIESAGCEVVENFLTIVSRNQKGRNMFPTFHLKRLARAPRGQGESDS